MPCYRCGTRQADPEAGKSSPWRRGVVREHQVLICPACVSSALADLTRCSRCGSAHLVRRLDQIECLDCRLVREAEPEPAESPPTAPSGAGSAPAGPAPAGSAPAGSAPAGSTPAGSAPDGPAPAGSVPGQATPADRDGDLAAEVARALERLRDNR